MASIPPAKTSTSATPPTETVEERFRRLAEAWHHAVAHLSSTTRRNNHPAYQEIIRMGPDVVPWLLRDMEENQTHWCSALRQITRANPIPESAAGQVPEMVDAWLRWAKDHGYRW